ncbi:MAG: family 43 glycosylhydrolase [Phycisphaerae bacterium]|nr:family 43 glycosylhydrolase [Phycisphaerae bacterium]
MPEVTGQRLSDIRLRDPFILSMPEEGVYYLFGTGWHLPGGPGFMVYRSKDLETFHGPTPAFCRPKGFWADRDYWAPEVHPYKGKYFMFASFKAGKACRGTQILVADAPAGPYRPYSDGPVTPRDWECLDGTLFIDRQNQPWIVFCHEWLQVGDGEMCAMPLRDDLKKASGSPILLFHASEAPWVVEVGVKPRGRVTDGPFLHRTSDGTLLMLWSSGGKRGYATGVARSESGTIRGPWRQESQPLYADDGGHGMIFHKHDGALMLALHQPNKKPDERPRLFRLQEKDGRLVILP